MKKIFGLGRNNARSDQFSAEIQINENTKTKELVNVNKVCVTGHMEVICCCQPHQFETKANNMKSV